ncbi:hypothetical protein CROQUDRAFT_52093, partial [Cronartium quercuum f. sp. fusiforme G11]
PMHKCLNQIYEIISSLKLTSQKSIQNFLTNKHISIMEKQGKWGTEKGWVSTKLLSETKGKLVKADNKSKVKHWSKE